MHSAPAVLCSYSGSAGSRQSGSAWCGSAVLVCLCLAARLPVVFSRSHLCEQLQKGLLIGIGHTRKIVHLCTCIPFNVFQ